jgi:hypothetical protein
MSFLIDQNIWQFPINKGIFWAAKGAKLADNPEEN